MKRKNLFWPILWIFVVVGASLWMDRPGTHIIKKGLIDKTVEIRRGLDLAGGVRLVYQLDLTKTQNPNDSVSSVIQTINRRINSLGVTEPTIQEGKIGNNRTVIVELPGISDTQQAINLIGKTAQLEFYEQPTDPEAAKNSPVPGFVPTGLTGSHLKSADVTFENPTTVGSGRSALITSTPIVSIAFDSEGTKQFAAITKKNLQKPLAIVIDNQLISAPTVQSVIDQGTATISGNFDVKSARELAISLKSGALPVNITLVQEQTIGATLGQESIERSLLAGLIGIILVMIFMIAYYGVKGIFASIALLLYTMIVVGVFKFIPITLTLAGIAGLILSIGAAVDANILIFERMKEEERLGRSRLATIDEGFKRAWSSIRDSNISSMLTAFILIWFGTGIVKGFAVTLLIGILVSLFSAITISQTLLILFYKPTIHWPKLKIRKLGE